MTTQTLPSDCYYNFLNCWSVLAVMNLKLQSWFVFQRLAQCLNTVSSTFHKNKIMFHALCLNSNDYKPSRDNFCHWCRIMLSRYSFVITRGLKSMHHADAFSPSVILVFGYLTHKKIYEIVIYEYVHDRKLLSYFQGEVIWLQYWMEWHVLPYCVGTYNKNSWFGTKWFGKFYYVELYRGPLCFTVLPTSSTHCWFYELNKQKLVKKNYLECKWAVVTGTAKCVLVYFWCF